MPDNSLEICLTAIDQRPGHFLLTCDTLHYPVRLNVETNVIFTDWVRRLQPVFIGQGDPARQLAPADLLRTVGTWLWQALFPESAPDQPREALAQALRTERTPLLLTFPDILAGLPWELLYDPQQAHGQGFLALRRPLLRFHPSAPVTTPLAPPLRVLLLISSPPSLGEDTRVDVESERAAVEQATRDVREAGLLHLLVEDIVTPRRVQQALIRFKPHIVHYIGHGGYGEATGGMLLWEDEQGQVLPFSGERLSTLLRTRTVHAVVLHACQTGRSNARIEVDGVAGALVQEGIPAVLAQQANFTYESSQRASETWYNTLAAGQGFAAALFEVRQALTLAERPDWAVPLLHGGAASLVPMLESTALPGPPDPQLANQRIVADVPTPTGMFVGRHRELRALRLMLEHAPGSGPVLALIIGPAGVGKSTLAAQAVIRYGGKYKAVLTLSCQGYQSIELFLQRLAEFLTRQEAPGFLEKILPDPKLSTAAKIEEGIAALNQAGPFLLVVDNLESVQNDDHALRDVSLLSFLQKLFTNLLGGGRVLITGRYAVKGLLPAGKFAANLLRLDLEDLSTYETQRLLTGHPALAHLGEAARQIIVAEFGGLPYVYDLLGNDAASQSLDLLIHDAQGRITQERKQRSAEEWQSVRRQIVEFAALETIVHQLEMPSRILLAQLSVLHRPFPLSAIEQGLGALRAVWQPLLDWSLLRYDTQEHTYQLHSITRRYAADLLDEEQRRQAQIQLANWYKRYAQYESHELTDYLDAHQLLRAAGEMQQAGELVMLLADILIRLGLYPLLSELCTSLLSDFQKQEVPLVAMALHQLGVIARMQGKYRQARDLYQQSREIYERLGDQRGCAGILHELGVIAQEQGKYEQAQLLYQQNLETFKQLDDQHKCATTLHHLGMIAQKQGRYEQARDMYQQSLAKYAQFGDQSRQAITLHQLGNIVFLQGAFEQAREIYQQNLEMYERLGDQRGCAHSLHQLGLIAQEQGAYGLAQGLYQQSLAIWEQRGDQRGYASSLAQLGSIAQEQGAYAQAQSLCQQSLDTFERLEDQYGCAQSLHILGNIAGEQGKYKRARDLYQQSLKIFERLGDLHGQAQSVRAQGSITYKQGEYKLAQSLYQQNLDISQRLGNQRGRAHALHALGDIAQEQKEYEQARIFYQQSLEMDEHLGDQRGRAQSLHQLGMIAQKQGAYELTRGLYQQSLDISQPLDDQSGCARSLYQLGNIDYDQGEYTQAQGLYQQSLKIFQRIDDQRGHAGSLAQLGRIAWEQGEYEQAQHFYQQSQAIFERLGDQRGQANILHQSGNMAVLRGAYEQAQSFYQQSLEISERLGDQGGRAHALHGLGDIAQHQGAFERAQSLYRLSLQICEQLGDQRGRAHALGELGTIAQEQGTYEQAQNLCQQSLEISERLGDQSGQATTLNKLGNIAYLQEEYEHARGLYQQSLKIFERLGDQNGRAKSLHALGNMAYVQEKYEQAQGLYQQSLKIKEHLGDQSGQAATLAQLGMIACEQEDFEQALRYTVQASILSDSLHSPHSKMIQRMIARIRRQMDETAFATCWETVAGDRPIPPASR